MDLWSGALRYLRVALFLALVYAGWTLAKRRTEPTPGRRGAAAVGAIPPAPDGDVKILQFYARDGVVMEGAGTILCYGVANARTVRLDPPVESVWPSGNRCFEIRPARQTRYTLTAEGADSRVVSESFQIEVTPDTSLLPKITGFRVAGCTRDYAGKAVFSLSFADQNAEEVSIDPPVFPTLHGSPYGQFYVSPEKTTTYTLTVAGKNGHVARKQLTVDVAACQ